MGKYFDMLLEDIRVKEGLKADAEARGQEGWTVTLQAPSYGPFMTYSSQRDLKEQL